MELTLTGGLARQILSSSKNDIKMAQALAKQYLSAIEPQAMAAYLLTEEVAISLLAGRLQKHPVATISALDQLPARGGAIRVVKRRAGGRPRKAGGRPARPARRRRRLTAGEVDRLKGQVTHFLARNGWTTRKELTATVSLDTQSIYRRIMGELQQEGRIVSKGEKSKAVYALKGGKKGKGRTRKPRAKKPGAKKPGAKKTGAKKTSAKPAKPKQV